MKKFFIAIAALALVASAACTKVNPEEKKSEKISFQVANYVPQTKAGEVSLISEGITSFKCKAFMVGEGVTTGTGVNDDGTQNFFGAGETITWDAEKIEWAPSHDYYWPKSKKSYINFFSWYDSSTTDGPTVTNGTMTWLNRTITTGDNIMYADPAWHFQSNLKQYPNLDDATVINEGVPTLFHHALAQIEIRAYAEKLTNGTATWTVTLKNITLGEIYNQGTLSLTATGNNAEPAQTEYNIKGNWDTASWVVSGSTGNLTPANKLIEKVKVTDPTAEQEYDIVLANQSVLPQDLDNVKLNFNLDIVTTYSNTSNHEIIPVEIPLAAAATATPSGFGTEAWALNTKYIYTIKIVPGENRVLFDPAVAEAWTTYNAPEKEL